MHFERRSIPKLLLALVLLSSACAEPPALAEDFVEPPPLRVTTSEVTAVELPSELRLTGSLKGEQNTDLAANATGQVTRTYVERGDIVKAGAVIAKLDMRSATLSLAEAELQVETSQTQESIVSADCARYEQLKARGAISAMEYDQATAKCKTAPLNLQVARKREELARKGVSDGVIRAPFSGVVTERFVSVGEYVQPATRVASIVRSGELRLEFGVPEANIAGVAEGAQVSFSVAAYPDKRFVGKVRYLAGVVRPATRDMIVEATVEGEQQGVTLHPGMFADVRLAVGTREVASVPAASVMKRQDRKHVFVVIDGRLEERILQAGPELGDRLAVEDGVAIGDQVAVGDLSALSNGAKVQ